MFIAEQTEEWVKLALAKKLKASVIRYGISSLIDIGDPCFNNGFGSVISACGIIHRGSGLIFIPHNTG